MKTFFLRTFAAVSSLTAATTATAGNGWTALSVPVDSPWAIAGLGAVVAVIAARVLVNRRK